MIGYTRNIAPPRRALRRLRQPLQLNLQQLFQLELLQFLPLLLLLVVPILLQRVG